MITFFKKTISRTNTVDITATLRSITSYAWIGSAVLFVGYSYFVGAITFSVIKQQALEQSMRAMVSMMSRQELSYLEKQRNLSLRAATDNGLVSAPVVAYATRARALAWHAE